MQNPLVSIVIPTFNSGKFIHEAIESCLGQSYSPIEIIVVDDGSTDDTRDRLDILIHSKAIKYVFQENCGAAVARNTGVQYASGEYVQFLDADDLILPEKIEKQVCILAETKELAIVACDFRYFHGRNKAELSGGDPFKGQFPLDYNGNLFRFKVVVHRWLFPRFIIQNFGYFDKRMLASEDWLFIWKLTVNRVRFFYLDEPLALYRMHDANTTRDSVRIAYGNVLAINFMREYIGEHNLHIYTDAQIRDMESSEQEIWHYDTGLKCLCENQKLKAFSHLLRAWFLHPRRRQSKTLLLLSLPWMRGSQSVDWVRKTDSILWNWRSAIRRWLVYK